MKWNVICLRSIEKRGDILRTSRVKSRRSSEKRLHREKLR